MKETLTVASNPNVLMEEDDKLFLIAWDYSSTAGYVLQMIDPADGNKVTTIGNATFMSADDNIKTKKLNEISFLKNAPEELATTCLSMLQVNDNNGDIYIGTTFFSAGNGNIYRFKKDGTFVEKFDCGGQNPNSAVFFN